MQMLKLIGAIAVGVLVALAAGWLLGTQGKSEVQRALQDAELRGMLIEARGGLLDARVSLYNVNFGDAGAKLEDTKAPLKNAQARIQSDDYVEAAKSVAVSLEHIEAAQRMAAKLDQGANTRAAEAVKALDAAIQSLGPPPSR